MNWFQKKIENQVYWVKKLCLKNGVFSYMICINAFTRKEIVISIDNNYSFFSFDKLVKDIKECKKDNKTFKLNLSFKRKKNVIEIRSYKIIPIISHINIPLKIFNIKNNKSNVNIIHKTKYHGMNKDDAHFFWIFENMTNDSYETIATISNLERITKGYNAGLYITLNETSLEKRSYDVYLKKELLKGAIHRELKKIQKRKLPIHIEITRGCVSKMKITTNVIRKANERVIDYSNPFH